MLMPLYPLIVDCGIPLSPINGSVLHYSGTKPGDYVTYKCNEGFRPSPAMNATCMSSDSRWSPLPERHNCIFIQGNIFSSVDLVAYEGTL